MSVFVPVCVCLSVCRPPPPPIPPPGGGCRRRALQARGSPKSLLGDGVSGRGGGGGGDGRPRGQVWRGGEPYPGRPMGITFHLGEDQVPGFEILAHGFSPPRRLLPSSRTGPRRGGSGTSPPLPRRCRPSKVPRCRDKHSGAGGTETRTTQEETSTLRSARAGGPPPPPDGQPGGAAAPRPPRAPSESPPRGRPTAAAAAPTRGASAAPTPHTYPTRAGPGRAARSQGRAPAPVHSRHGSARPPGPKLALPQPARLPPHGRAAPTPT